VQLIANQSFPPGAYIFHTQTLFPYLRDNSISQSSFSAVELLPVHLRPGPLRAQRSGELASGTRGLASIHLLGCAGNKVFGERLPRLLTGEIVFLHSDGSRSTTASSSWWMFAGLHCEHLSASIVVRYFTQHTMSTSVNGAAGAFGTGPSSGYNPNRLSFIFTMSTVVFALFISNLSSDKIAHMHLYATTILCVIFWIKSNIKMSNFLTRPYQSSYSFGHPLRAVA